MANLTPNQPVMGTVDQPSSGPLQQFYIRMTPPKWTRILLGCNIAVFVLMTIYGFLVYSDLNGTQITGVLITFGAKVNILVAQGQVWRLLTAMFIHIGGIFSINRGKVDLRRLATSGSHQQTARFTPKY